PKINSRNLTSTLRSLLQLKRAYRDSITSLRETQLLSPLPEKPSSSLLSQRNPAPLSSPRETQLLSPLPEKPSSSLLSQRNTAPLSSPRETQLLSPLLELEILLFCCCKTLTPYVVSATHFGCVLCLFH